MGGSAPTSAGAGARVLHMGGGTILMIEPNPGILIVARNVLVRAGYSVLAVAQARQGLELARERRVDVVLLDARQATPETVRALGKTRIPSLTVIVTVQKGREASGLGTVELVRPPDGFEVIEKPFAPDRLLRTVERAIDRWGERTEPLGADVIPLRDDFEDDFSETDQTDIFPFAELLQHAAEPQQALEDDDTKLSRSFDPRAAGLAARVRAALDRERLPLAPEEVASCVRALETVLEEEAKTPEPRRPSSIDSGAQLAVAGFIQHLPIDQILQIATNVEAPARCRLEVADSVIEIYYRGSHVLFARQDNLPTGFMLGRILVSQGLVSPNDLERTLDARVGAGGWIGQRLLALGHLSESALSDGLRRQTEELVFESVRWTHGRFAVFAREEMPPEAAQADLRIPVQHLLLEGMRRLDEWHLMAGTFGDLGLVLDRLDRADAQELIQGLPPEARQVLEFVDGRRTVGDLVQSVARPTFEVFRALHSLAGQRLVSARGSI